ncbi:MAG: carboxyl transferase domain-containing protein [Pseudomonadota bacterium]
MPAFQTRAQLKSEAFQKNREDMLALVGELRALEARAVAASDKRTPTFRKRGQLTPRERLDALLDPGMPFLRLHSLANFMVENPDPEKSVPGASAIGGIGFVSGVRCMVLSDDSGIKAGAMTAKSLPVVCNMQLIALKHKLPFIHLVESAGADLTQYKVEMWAAGGMVFRNLAWLSAAGVPTITVLHGPSTAGGAYMPGMSDYVIGVKKNGMAALAGAALTKAATGEEADERQLGGTEMHATVSGLVEYLAEDDAHGVEIARDVVARLGWNRRAATPKRMPYEPPKLNSDEIAGVVPTDYKVAYDVREVMARFLDASDFDEFKPGYGPATICAQGSVTGFAVGVIGNNGPLDPDGATKAAQFIQLCDQAETPLIFLNNITGYMVGTEYEQKGMIKHGSKMIQAVSNVRVPKISFYIGASYGAGNYGMAGYAYEPDFLFAWPNSTSGVMGGEQASKTMVEVFTQGAKRRGVEVPAEMIEAEAKKIRDVFEAQESAFYTSGLCLDHGVIDPRDTRKVIAMALETVLEGKARTVQPNAFGVARM